MSALVDHAVTRYGRLDCIFNNAGGPAPTGGIEDIPVAGFDAAMALLIRSVMLGMKHAAPVMRRQGGGSIINNGSIAGNRAGYSSSVIYGAAKAAVIHLTRCVAMELGESNIRVNSISPGAIVTGIFGKALGLSVEKAEKTAKLAEERFAKSQPIPRAGMPEDIARAAVFLASDEFELRQRPRSRRRWRRHRRAQLEPAAGRPPSAAQRATRRRGLVGRSDRCSIAERLREIAAGTDLHPLEAEP